MNTHTIFESIRSRWSPAATIGATTLAVIIISILCLLSGSFAIFQNFFYIPIIIACIYYTKRGILFSIFIACIYFFLILGFTRDAMILVESLISSVIFILVAAVTTRLAMERKKAEDTLTGYKDHLEDLVAERTRELNDARIIAEKASKAKSDFLANMSHEIRTPLSSVIGFSELLYDEIKGPLNDNQKKYLGYITTSGRHLLSLINDILDLSKVESGKMELSRTRLSIVELLKTSLLFVAEKALKHGVKLHLEVSEDLRMIEADERKVKQVVFNLVSNSVKFTPDGGSIYVGAEIIDVNSATVPEEVRERLSDMEYVLVKVRDTGIGIAVEDRAKIFTQFSQIEEPYSKKYEGTGLGLALSKKLVELHGGAIWFNSDGKGKGCTFFFVLPVKGSPPSD